MLAIGCTMPSSDPRPLDAAILDQAIQWLVTLRFDQPTADALQRFDQWHAQDAEHARAWQQVTALGNEFSRLPPQLTRQTLNGAKQHMNRRQSLKLLGLFAASGAVLWSVRDHTPLPGLLADYQSGVGERRLVQLADGSRIQMNSGSAFNAQLPPERRLLELHQGEILIDTGSDPQQPFWVHSRDGYLRATGSGLLVRQRDQGTQLAIRTGSVAIFPGTQAQAPAHVLQAGEQALFTSSGLIPTRNDGLDPWAWTAGVISANDMRLGDFLAELGRHRHGLLQCSEAVANLRVSGTYQLADTDEVLALLARSLAVRIDYRTRYWVTVSA